VSVAIVGSGIAGLAAAYAIGRTHPVEIFEADSYVGGHVRTVHVSERGRDVPIDMGFIVYNENRYPNLTRLFADLRVTSRPTDMSFSVRRDDTGFEYGTSGLRSLFARRRDLLRPGHYRLLTEIVRFVRLGKRSVGAAGLEGLTMAEFLERHGVSRDAIDLFVIPLGASIWSTSPTRMLEFPASTYLHFCDAHGMLDLVGAPQWRTLVGGSQTYVRALLANLPARVHLETPVRRIRREVGGVVLEFSGGPSRRFDRCVLAAHSDQSLAILADPSALERTVLGAIGYSRNTAWLHTDASLLPRRAAARAAWNFQIATGEVGERATLTYWMNRLQGLDAAETYCVSLNPTRSIPSTYVIERVEFAHPLFDLAAIRAQKEIAKLQGLRGTYYCGAWQRYGFHEDGMASGLDAGRRLLAEYARRPLEDRP